MDRRFTGKICPYCKAPFQSGDVIVTCSTCEMPHHLSCWQENGGCTTYGCTGMIKETLTLLGNPQRTPSHSNRSQNQTTGVNQNRSRPRNASLPKSDTLYKANPMTIQSNIPVVLEEVVLLIDRGSNSLKARCSFRSLTEKPILSMLVAVDCFDIWGNPTKAVDGIQYLGLNTSRDSAFGNDSLIPIPDKKTTSIDVSIRRVVYNDRTVTMGGKEKDALKEQISLQQFFWAQQELIDEYVRDTTRQAKYAPVIGKTYWKCTCGAINTQAELSCHRCKSKLPVITKLLDVDVITAKLNERKQKEEEKRLQRSIERTGASSTKPNYCRFCGSSLESDSQFCSNCGEKIELLSKR